MWESLSATDFEAGAAKDFSRQTQALREYAIAGVLHFKHLSSIRESTQYELIKRLRTNELARALAETPQTVAEN
ncbi:7-cyano-7-deazaguanine synthase, partial [Pseudomonas aeruginosa]